MRSTKTWWHDLAPGVFRMKYPGASIADIHRVVNTSAKIVHQRPMTYSQVYHDLRKACVPVSHVPEVSL